MLPLVLSTSVGVKLLDKLVSDVYDLSKGHVSKALALWRSQAALKTAFTTIASVRMVKTIWQYEKDVDLLGFYCPTKVFLKNGRKEIADFADLEHDGNVVLQGTVGQGKSIFCRFLTYAELTKGVSFPVFCELRRLKDGSSLTAHLLTEIASLGLNITDNVFHFLADTGA